MQCHEHQRHQQYLLQIQRLDHSILHLNQHQDEENSYDEHEILKNYDFPYYRRQKGNNFIKNLSNLVD